MQTRARDWQDQRVERLEERLFKAEEKIRKLERRPLDWALKVEVALMWIFMAAIWILVIVETAAKN